MTTQQPTFAVRKHLRQPRHGAPSPMDGALAAAVVHPYYPASRPRRVSMASPGSRQGGRGSRRRKSAAQVGSGGERRPGQPGDKILALSSAMRRGTHTTASYVVFLTNSAGGSESASVGRCPRCASPQSRRVDDDMEEMASPGRHSGAALLKRKQRIARPILRPGINRPAASRFQYSLIDLR